MNYTRHFDCGCKVVVIGELTNATIAYCPLHKSAPELYEALIKIRSITPKTIMYSIANDAIAKAEEE